jgi:RND family efflux transporter MFP subunit
MNYLTKKIVGIIGAVAALGILGAVALPQVFDTGGPTDGLPKSEAVDSGKGDHAHGEVISGGKNSLYPIVTVTQPKPPSDSEQTIEAAGQVLALQHADIYPRREGIVQSLSVNLGDRVRKGQVVASLQPDQSQAELAADLAFKQRELEIAQERLTISSDSQKTIAEVSLEAGEKDKEARLQKIDAEIQAIGIASKQSEVSVENAAYDLIDAATILMYTRTDAISQYYSYANYDYYRRKDIFYPKDTESKAVEKQLLALYQGLRENDYEGESLQLVTVAMNTASAVRSISANASKDADYTDENSNQRGEISEVVDHLAELSTELVISTSELSVLEAEKQSILAGSTQSLLEIKSAGRGSQLDISLLEAEVERIRSQMGAARTVYAPFSGVITKRFVNVGDSVNLDRPLYTLIDDENMFIRFYVTETDLPFVELESAITFAPTSAPSHIHKAVVARISKSIDPETRSILIEADLDPEEEDGHALSQMTVRTYIPTVHSEGLLSIPENALELSGKSNQVWIVSEEIEAELRPVKVQYIHNGTAYIEEGLTGKDWVIIKSPVELKEGLEIDTTQST